MTERISDEEQEEDSSNIFDDMFDVLLEHFRMKFLRL